MSSGEATARVDEKGTAVLTIGDLDTPTFTVTVKAGGYRTEKVVIANTTTQATTVAMVSQRKEVYVSKQSGKYDVYKIDIDGKNKQLLLAGSGRERDQMTLVPHQTDETVALVSSRDDKRNQDGYLLDTLSLINVTNGNVTTLEHSERIQIVDWIGDRLIYVKIKAGTSGGNNERNQLMSYNYSTTNRQVLASANNFSDIVSAKGVLYYASFYNGSTQPQFAKITPDNTGKQTILTTNIWDIIRTSYDDLYLASSDVWYSYRLGDATARKLDKAPSNPNDTRFYLDAPGSKRALWTESRDGKGVLLTYDATTRKDTTLVSQAGLTYPLRWLDSRTVTYRVSTQQESATYAVSVDGGAPRKIVDVTNVSGLGRWYYGYY